jgi:hypothetical protein
MIQPIKAKRINGTDGPTKTNIRTEICNSGLFNSIHSSRQTHDEDWWILVVSNKIHMDAATKFFNNLDKSVYATQKSQIQIEERILSTPIPMIEDREQMQARSNDTIRHKQGTAWESIVTDNQTLTGGSKMRNMSRPKSRKIVEISFDPESQAQFPNLSTKTTSRQARNTRKNKPNEDVSPTSSHSDSIISAVTRAEFENLSQGIEQMIKNEVQSTLTTSTDQTMMTMFRDEMAANRIATQKQMNLIQNQLTSFQNLVNGLMPHLTHSLSNSPTTQTTVNNQTVAPNPEEYNYDQQDHINPTTHQQEIQQQPLNTQEEPKSPPKIKKVSMADQKMPATISHNDPSAS